MNRLRYCRPILTLILAILSFTAECIGKPRVSVRGYHKKDGTYVRPHTRSAPSRNAYSYGANYGYPSVIQPGEATLRTPLRPSHSEHDAISEEHRAASALKVAKDYIQKWDGQLSDGLKLSLVDIIHRYPDTPAASEAKSILDKSQNETKSLNKVNVLKQHINIRMGVVSDRTKLELLEIIKQHPGSAGAKQAEAILDAEVSSQMNKRFKTGEQSLWHAQYTFDGYVDGSSIGSPNIKTSEIDVNIGDKFPQFGQPPKASWWKFVRTR